MDKSKTLQKATLGGSILAAITASLCCIGPLIAVALGAGGFAASALFEKWRPVFLGVTFALLTLAWYLTYRKPKAACKEGSACATKPVSKWNKVILWLATGVVLLTAAFPSLSSAILRGNQRPTPAVVAGPNSAILKVKIPSMDCAACAASIQAKLRKQSGIENAEVSFDTKEAVLQYDTTRLSPEKIIAAIDETGFKAEVAKPRDKVTLKVAGMTCAGCAKNVEGALKKMEGVKTVQVDLDTGKAVVTGDPAKLKTDQLIAAVKQAGYKAQLATGKAPANDSKKSALYKCESCGKTYDKPGDCCGAPTKKVN